MAYAVTHVIVAIVLIDLYRDYIAKKKFSTWYVLIGGIAGLLPDIDVPVQWMASNIVGKTITFHRIWTHSVVFVVSFLIIGILFHLKKNKKLTLPKSIFKKNIWKKISYGHIALFFIVVGVGWLTHIVLDCGLAGDYNLTWLPGNPLGFCPHPLSSEHLYGLDAVILILWLVHEQWAHKIKDFI